MVEDNEFRPFKVTGNERDLDRVEPPYETVKGVVTDTLDEINQALVTDPLSSREDEDETVFRGTPDPGSEFVVTSDEDPEQEYNLRGSGAYRRLFVDYTDQEIGYFPIATQPTVTGEKGVGIYEITPEQVEEEVVAGVLEVTGVDLRPQLEQYREQLKVEKETDREIERLKEKIYRKLPILFENWKSVQPLLTKSEVRQFYALIYFQSNDDKSEGNYYAAFREGDLVKRYFFLVNTDESDMREALRIALQHKADDNPVTVPSLEKIDEFIDGVLEDVGVEIRQDIEDFL